MGIQARPQIICKKYSLAIWFACLNLFWFHPRHAIVLQDN